MAAAANASKRVLDIWFKGFIPGKPLSPDMFGLWFGGSKEIDNMLRNEFEKDAERALVDAEFRKEMNSTGEGAVALAVLLDQVPRNIFRSSPRPFVEFDPLAREAVKEVISKKLYLDVHPVFRYVLYMPLEHSENVADQEQCVKEFTREYETVDPQYKPLFENFVKYAKDHEAVIKEFGRFPHRNEVLGRVPTETEVTYLANGGARW